MKKKLAVQTVRKSLAPAKSLDQDASVEHCQACATVDEKYRVIDAAVIASGLNKLIKRKSTRRISAQTCKVCDSLKTFISLSLSISSPSALVVPVQPHSL